MDVRFGMTVLGSEGNKSLHQAIQMVRKNILHNPNILRNLKLPRDEVKKFVPFEAIMLSKKDKGLSSSYEFMLRGGQTGTKL